MVRRLSLLVAVTVLAVGGYAWAARAPGPKLAHFRLAGDEIAVPMPAGLCDPKGGYVDGAQAVAAADNDNITLITLYDCAEMARGEHPSHYAMIKAPKSGLSKRATREELVKGMGDIPKTNFTDKIQRDKLTEVGGNVSKVLGEDVAFTGNIAPIDKDDLAFYLGGVVGLSLAGDAPQNVSVVVAVTAVKGHIISYNFYGPGDRISDVAAVLRRAKSEVKRLVDAN
jgi:hypothetical protein